MEITFALGILCIIFALITIYLGRNSDTPYLFVVAICLIIAVNCFTECGKLTKAKWTCCDQINYYDYCSVCGEERPIQINNKCTYCKNKLNKNDNFCPKCGKERPENVTTENIINKEKNEEENND